jgi:hypothetical protein
MAVRTDKMRRDRRIITRARADMDDALSVAQAGMLKPACVQRWLAVIDAALGSELKIDVLVDENRLGERQDIISPRLRHVPRRLSKEMFPPDSGKRVFEPW